MLRKAFSRFDEQDSNYIDFVAEHGDWVEDYGFYMALKENFDYQSWQSWPESSSADLLKTKLPSGP